MPIARQLRADLQRGTQTVVGVRRRHADVDDRQVGLVQVDDPEQFVGIADGGDDILAGVGQDAGQSGPQEHGVLGDHDPHGISTRIVVGPPSGLIT